MTTSQIAALTGEWAAAEIHMRRMAANALLNKTISGRWSVSQIPAIQRCAPNHNP